MVAFSGVSETQHDDNGNVVSIRDMTAFSLVFCPNTEVELVADKVFAFRICVGPYAFLCSLSVEVRDAGGTVVEQENSTILGGGLHFSGMIRMLRVLNFALGVNVMGSNLPWESGEETTLILYATLSLGFWRTRVGRE